MYALLGEAEIDGLTIGVVRWVCGWLRLAEPQK